MSEIKLAVEFGDKKTAVVTKLPDSLDELLSVFKESLKIDASTELQASIYDNDFSEYMCLEDIGSVHNLSKIKLELKTDGGDDTPGESSSERKFVDVLFDIWSTAMDQEAVSEIISEMTLGIDWTASEALSRFHELEEKGEVSQEYLAMAKKALEMELRSSALAAIAVPAAKTWSEECETPKPEDTISGDKVKLVEEMKSLAGSGVAATVQRPKHSYGEVEVHGPPGKSIEVGFTDFSQLAGLPTLPGFLTGADLLKACSAEVSIDGTMVPTPIQKASFPLVIRGDNVIGCAETGSGKTLCFIVGALSKIVLAEKTCQAIIIQPTNNMVDQCADVLARVCLKLQGLVTSAKLQQAKPFPFIDQGGAISPQIIVGTASQIGKAISKRWIISEKIRMLVLDEVDETFKNMNEHVRRGPQNIRGHTQSQQTYDVNWIHRQLPRVQTLLYSATLPDAQDTTERALWNWMKTLAPEAFYMFSTKTIVDKIFHLNVVYLQEQEKNEALAAVLRQRKGKCLIFVNSREKANVLQSFIDAKVEPNTTRCITSKESLEERLKLLTDFKDPLTSINYVVATDQLSHGVDIPYLSIVINHELPEDRGDKHGNYRHIANNYLHRSGRTGRAGNTGLVVNFLSAENVEKMRAIYENIKERRKQNRDLLYNITGVCLASDISKSGITDCEYKSFETLNHFSDWRRYFGGSAGRIGDVLESFQYSKEH